MKRFLVLFSLAAAAGAVVAGQGQAAPNPDAAARKLGWKLCCQAYTFRALTTYETIDTVHQLGIHYIEFYPGQTLSKDHPGAKLDHNMPDDLIAELKQKLKAADIKAMNYGVVGLDNNEANDRKVFEFAKKLGLETIVSEPPEDSFDLIDRLCQEYNINVALHDHPKPSRYWNPDHVLEVVNGHSRRVGSCSDTGHWYRSGLVPVDCLKKLEGRIISFHLKDLTPRPNITDTPWGTGVCDVKAMLSEVKRQGIHPVFSIEYESTSGQQLVDNVAKCRDYFRQVTEELAKSK